jgi:hypothetical protein
MEIESDARATVCNPSARPYILPLLNIDVLWTTHPQQRAHQHVHTDHPATPEHRCSFPSYPSTSITNALFLPMQRLIPRRHHQRLALPVVLVGGISPIAVELVPLGHLHVRLERARFDVLTGRLEAIIARQAHHIVMLVGQRFV